ncbi:MAG: hypothetical protein GNW80_07445 [Asgard group archaeon]|nr:hypothetical protein [Asgard group archaeon]
MSDLNKREFIALPLDLCFFDRKRFDKLRTDTPLEIISYRKYDNGLIRTNFITKTLEKGKETDEREHLLWIQIIDIDGKKHVMYRCDCKYFEYRQLRPAKRMFDLEEISNSLCVVIPSKSYTELEKLFNIDKHAFLALEELFNHHVQISI